ncbi:hypothetical protein Q8F55_005811 [Vanrija albida]|uniref:Uncharacterized protein n=1 Tax=Vanrija albida TaxID=181172 RepID=A0ABR3Q2L5_9TREE
MAFQQINLAAEPGIELLPSCDRVVAERLELEGEEGAIKILNATTNRAAQIDAGHNQLTAASCRVLFEGLTIRHQAVPSCPTRRLPETKRPKPLMKPQCMSTIDLCDNNIGDEGLLYALKYCAEDHGMMRLNCRGAWIKLEEAYVDQMVEYINASHLETLDLGYNHLSPAGAIRFFSQLEGRLCDLELKGCVMPVSVAPAIAEYLASPRSRSLRRLGMKYNNLGLKGFKVVMEALERSNFTLEELELFATNDPYYSRAPREHEWYGGKPDVTELAIANMPAKEYDELSSIIDDQIFDVLGRNEELGGRVNEAVTRVLVPARIILHGREPTKAEAKRQVKKAAAAAIEAEKRKKRKEKERESSAYRHLWEEPSDEDELSEGELEQLEEAYLEELNDEDSKSDEDWTTDEEAELVTPKRWVKGADGIWAAEAIEAEDADDTTDPPPPPELTMFPVLKLPPELQVTIAEYSSQDVAALSRGQWSRIYSHLKDRKSLGELARQRRDWMKGHRVLKTDDPFVAGMQGAEFETQFLQKYGLMGWEDDAVNRDLAAAAKGKGKARAAPPPEIPNGASPSSSRVTELTAAMEDLGVGGSGSAGSSSRGQPHSLAARVEEVEDEDADPLPSSSKGKGKGRA